MVKVEGSPRSRQLPPPPGIRNPARDDCILGPFSARRPVPGIPPCVSRGALSIGPDWNRGWNRTLITRNGGVWSLGNPREGLLFFRSQGASPRAGNGPVAILYGFRAVAGRFRRPGLNLIKSRGRDWIRSPPAQRPGRGPGGFP